MEVKMPDYRNAKRNDILRHDGKMFVPVSLEELIGPLKAQIKDLQDQLLVLEQQNKDQVKKILTLIKEINQNG
jgi:chaperonin cofactor prefoldin